MECTHDKKHEFFDSNGEPKQATHVVTNSVGTWRNEVCYQCWQEFIGRAFVSIQRTGNTFVATAAF